MHVEVYKIKGRLYKYSVRNYRVGEKVKHKKKYLGPVERVREWKRGRKRKLGGGRKPALFVRQFKASERMALERALASGKSFTKERIGIILSSASGKSAKEIALAISSDARRVRAAIKDFNKRGVLCLQRGKTTGRKPVFDKRKTER